MYIGESGEDYLEAVLILRKKGGAVRSIELANFMGYAKPSITHAVRELRKKGLITKNEEGELYLTEEGEKIAVTIYGRHCFFYNLLCELGIDEQTAQHDACRMEHSMSEESFQRLKKKINELRILEQEKKPKKKD